MLEEYVRPISRDALLTDEERRRMTEENHRRARAGRPAEPEVLSAEPEPRMWDTVREKTRFARRSNRSEFAFRTAAADDTAGAFAAYEEGSERKRAQDRRRMSEQNRIAAHYCAEEQPVRREPRYRVPTDEELIAELRAKKAEEQQDTEKARIRRMQQSSANRSRADSGSSGGGGGYYPPLAMHSASPFPYVSGSSAIAVNTETERQEQQEREVVRPAVRQPEPERQTADLPEAAENSDRKRAVRGGRFSLARRVRIYPKRMNAVRIILIGAVAVALLGMVIYGRVQTNELYTEISALKAQYDDIEARNVSMRSEMEGKMTVKNIEEYAADVLKLRPLDKSQIQYIQIQTEDEVTVTEPESNWVVGLKDFFSDIWNFLRGA
ncbi:MAG: hypothetical protein K6E36_02400 [Oscillospiraceae bacterium]|nr:hypothetical protein [Oscillospiraceae bacterium]